jgi:drug/metabolite transporter (DMT)-like permease
VLVGGDARPSLGELWPAVGAGAAGAVGLGALYRGMAVGAMGIVAPISAASPVVPLGVDLARGIVPSALQWLGIAVVLGGITLLARERDGVGRAGLAAGVGLALVAALGFGLFVVGLDAAADESVSWTILAVRSTSTLLAFAAVVAVSAPVRPPARLLPMILAVGVFDTAANVLVAFATTHGPAGIVAVLSALYPVTTILLARILLAERLGRERRVGAVLALGGAAAVAVG